jgi:uncharacterized protein
MTLVQNLLNLYRVDGQVRALRSRVQAAERHLKAQEKTLNDLNLQQQELQTRRKHVQATIGNLEVEVKAIDERLEKLRQELNSAATNKQYSALLTELNTIKASRATVEDRMLTEMEQVERLQQQIAELEPQIAERTKIRDLAKAQLEERRSDVGSRLSELEAERERAAAVVPADVLTMFDEVADNFDGESMAPIEQIGRREYVCGACNMQLTLQLTLSASRGDTLIRCQSCGRILFMQDETKGTLVKK